MTSIDWTDLETRNAAVNAFVDWDRSAQGGSGPLAGLTAGIKANIMVAGLPWTAGMALHRDRIAPRDAAIVATLRAAGAAILGTVNMHEAALGATTDNPWYGRTHNPLRHDFTPGGSSGGSAAAVAAGLCDFTLGTDTMGSVRIPAAYCGVYGLKPTHGAIDDDGLAPLEPAYDCIGPIARSLDVLERVWSVVAPPAAAPTPLTRIFTLADLDSVGVDPAVRSGYYAALDALGGTPRTLKLSSPMTAIRPAGFVAAGRWLAADLGDLRRAAADQISAELHWLLDYCEGADPRTDILVRTRKTVLDTLGDGGFLIMPTAPQTAFLHGRPPINQADFTCLASIAGLPALAIPAGKDADGLPVGVQIVGPANSEAQLFAIARTLDTKLNGDV